MERPVRDMAANFKQRLEELQQLQRNVADVKATARTRNGDVWVEVGSRGNLRDIQFSPQALKRMSAQQLTHTVLALIAEASEQATDQAKEMTAAFLPEEMADRLRAGEQDLMAFFPKAPRILEFDQD
ncbi:YbaB/EbfC family nucleoid-associated protein [Actinoallomurus sp. NPDC050550]|uniref:YbaB/EbfC family nucleoid-associated protein n=1 Tax=Actinoallomurus sp. NPDC050550 TaxID=3154937 RepID=UPI0033D8C574